MLMFHLKAANLLLLDTLRYIEVSDVKNPDGETLNLFELLGMMIH